MKSMNKERNIRMPGTVQYEWLVGGMKLRIRLKPPVFQAMQSLPEI